MAAFFQCDASLNPEDSIRNTIARYPLAVDSKEFSTLSAVFTDDAYADYGQGVGVLEGLATIEAALSASYVLLLSSF